MDELEDVKITKIIKAKSKKAIPIIANFQNGLYTKTEQIKTIRVDDSESSTKYSLIATPQGIYKADITKSDTKLLNTFLAVRNRRTNEMTLVPVQEATFKHSAFDLKSSAFENNIVDTKKAIAKEFGGKKAAAGFERSKKTRHNIEVLESALKKEIENMDDEKVKIDNLEIDPNQFTIFPKLDCSGGKSVREVFKVTKLIGKEAMEILSGTSLEVLSMDQRKLRLANNYLTTSVKSIQTTRQPDSPENIEKVSLLIYIDALVRIINNRKRNWEKTEISPFSADLGLAIRKSFKTNGEIANSTAAKQKASILYMILMLMSTERLEIDIDSLLDEVEITKTELLKYAKIVGAKTKEGGNFLYINKINLDKNSQLNAPMALGNRKRKMT